MNQHEMSKINRSGWEQSAYKAWVNRHGEPQEYAKCLKANPEKAVAHYLPFMGNVKGKKIVNLLGSKGNKAVSFALLGADVTVVDLSSENQRYATQLADAASVHIHYIISDVLDIPTEHQPTDMDFVLLEVGVLHYFVDLPPLFEMICRSLKPGGKLILRDYHPMVSKLLSVEDDSMVAKGNYFDEGMKEVDVAYSILLPEGEREALTKNRIRRWTLGEIITSIAKAGLKVESLEEEAGIKWAFPPHAADKIEERIPGLYTILAEKTC
ncbi:class I SAM-dependent methyltransferase [Rossellomorea aquimaris]|uniref:class I SAM-dependent methyltransferase n=1 Tax=Rossellomorea aquimaris TaxID=189382 RepID=UPI001CD5EBD2|nr:class I SAM-dependent methyltransferase [Rossellomorea aquimaris]MCA1054129.1 class I SAM-dependent methyltransferase [Rossellomorea aquimaris]